jgi:hypothetical protein
MTVGESNGRSVQAVFRAANERLRTRLEDLSLHGRRPVICECSDDGCMEVLQVEPEEYRQVRDRGYYIVIRGHSDPNLERVVDRRDGFDVVEKNGIYPSE